MNPDVALDAIWMRLVLLAAIVVAGVVMFRVLNALLLARARRYASLPVAVDAERRTRPRAATLLYFTAPGCAPCKTTQRPAIQRLVEQVGDALEVIEIDAGARPEVAGEWGVMSVPTTFVLDAQGNPRHVNHGVASVEKLLRQIQEVR